MQCAECVEKDKRIAELEDELKNTQERADNLGSDLESEIETRKLAESDAKEYKYDRDMRDEALGEIKKLIYPFV